ncbi:MAG: methylmalonyl Co-A mutase-associated GTPase MeaB [bacterium]|nr:methylmalonyl Co-A mutase-associated GTPase MeaB [bacterium]
MKTVVDFIRDNDTRSFARLLTKLESGDVELRDRVNREYTSLGRADRIGITGPPGAGKSSLVTMMAKRYRELGKTVAIIAVDPSSPFSGGALLGDRIRMQILGGDSGVFIRSMASRGASGGLARGVDEAADLFDLGGYDVILLETVGVGQSELEVARAADTTLVVLVPQSGDSIQGMKAGLMEIADVFVMNKSDSDGADRATQQLSSAISLKMWDGWTPPVLNTIATENKGIVELIENIDTHHRTLAESGMMKTRRDRRFARRLRSLLTERVERELWGDGREAMLLAGIETGRAPSELVEELYRSFRGR